MDSWILFVFYSNTFWDDICFVVELRAHLCLKMPHIENDLKLDFKDVLLRPKRSTLKSRSEVSALL